jgi:hypothetical protein
MPVYDIVLESALSTGEVLFTVSVPVNAYSRESACECALKMFPHCQVAADRAVRCWPTLKEQEEIGSERRAALESRRQPDEPISTAHEGITFPRVRLNSDPADVYLPAPLIEEAEPKGSRCGALKEEIDRRAHAMLQHAPWMRRHRSRRYEGFSRHV